MASYKFTLELLLLIIVGYVEGQGQNFKVSFSPPKLMERVEDTTDTVKWEINSTKVMSMSFEYTDTKISTVTKYNIDPSESSGNFTIRHDLVGFNDIKITFIDENDQVITDVEYETSVIVSYQLLNDIFTYSISVLTALFNFNMGASVDLQVVKKIIKAPVGPAIGSFCQYVVMPVLAFTLGLLIFPNENEVLLRLGLFLNGCCPGGGGSNMYTLLLGGSLDLSIMMTSISSLLAFAAIPAWVLSLGPVILDESGFKIPYDQITYVVLSLMIPSAFGILVQFYCLRLKKVLDKIIKYFATFNIIYTFTFGIYSNAYIFSYFDYKVLIAGCALPWSGFALAMIIAKLFRQPYKNIIAIGIDTGLQNVIIALVIMKTTLGSPAGDIGFVVPAFTTIMTPVPLVTLGVVRYLYQRFKKPGEPKQDGVKAEENPAFTLEEEKEKPKRTEKEENKVVQNGNGHVNSGAEIHI